MKFTVDLDLCENYGQCAYTAPELFSLDDSGEQAFRAAGGSHYTSDRLDDAGTASAERAAAICPTQAISMVAG
jgi:ferredoxin